jgi:hypothetical protein
MGNTCGTLGAHATSTVEESKDDESVLTIAEEEKYKAIMEQETTLVRRIRRAKVALKSLDAELGAITVEVAGDVAENSYRDVLRIQKEEFDKHLSNAVREMQKWTSKAALFSALRDAVSKPGERYIKAIGFDERDARRKSESDRLKFLHAWKLVGCEVLGNPEESLDYYRVAASLYQAMSTSPLVMTALKQEMLKGNEGVAVDSFDLVLYSIQPFSMPIEFQESHMVRHQVINIDFIAVPAGFNVASVGVTLPELSAASKAVGLPPSSISLGFVLKPLVGEELDDDRMNELLSHVLMPAAMDDLVDSLIDCDDGYTVETYSAEHTLLSRCRAIEEVASSSASLVLSPLAAGNMHSPGLRGLKAPAGGASGGAAARTLR